jgi:hypothetical protein
MRGFATIPQREFWRRRGEFHASHRSVNERRAVIEREVVECTLLHTT